MPRHCFALALIACLSGASPLWAADGTVTPGDGLVVAVPSGQTVTLWDVIWNVPGTGGLVTRFRFIAPAIAAGGGIDNATASADMQHLCDSFALPRVQDNEPPPEQIIISVSDVPVDFGQPAPDATQYFESYRITDGTCMWELF